VVGTAFLTKTGIIGKTGETVGRLEFCREWGARSGVHSPAGKIYIRKSVFLRGFSGGGGGGGGTGGLRLGGIVDAAACLALHAQRCQKGSFLHRQTC